MFGADSEKARILKTTEFKQHSLVFQLRLVISTSTPIAIPVSFLHKESYMTTI